MRKFLLALAFAFISPLLFALEFYSLEGYVLPKRVYVGQNFEICIDVIASHNARIELSTPSGLPSSISIGKQRAAKVSTKTLDGGQNAFVHTIAFPARSSEALLCEVGELDIAVRMVQRVNSFFGTTERIVERRLPVVWRTFEILPLPSEGRPDDFSGAVGNFAISMEVEPRELSVGDIAQVSISLSGEGSLNGATVVMPKLSERLFKIYQPEKGALRANELARLTANVIPLSTQSVEIASARFSYFDPAAEAYKSAVAQALSLTFCEKAPSGEPAVRTLDIGSSSQSDNDASEEFLQLYLAPSKNSLKTHRIPASAKSRILDSHYDGQYFWEHLLILDSRKTGWLPKVDEGKY